MKTLVRLSTLLLVLMYGTLFVLSLSTDSDLHIILTFAGLFAAVSLLIRKMKAYHDYND